GARGAHDVCQGHAVGKEDRRAEIQKEIGHSGRRDEKSREISGSFRLSYWQFVMHRVAFVSGRSSITKLPRFGMATLVNASASITAFSGTRPLRLRMYAANA